MSGYLMPLVEIAIILFAYSYLVKQAVGRLMKTHPGDVQTVWYFFSLSFLVTALLTLWAAANGYVDEGGFHGQLGHFLRLLFLTTKDFVGEIFMLCVLVTVIVVPQLMSYVLSGLFGCASSPWFVQASIRFLVWGAVKAFIVVAGVGLAFALLAPQGHAFPNDVVVGLGTSALMSAAAFTALDLYRRSEAIADWCGRIAPTWATRLCKRGHTWATRNRQ